MGSKTNKNNKWLELDEAVDYLLKKEVKRNELQILRDIRKRKLTVYVNFPYLSGPYARQCDVLRIKDSQNATKKQLESDEVDIDVGSISVRENNPDLKCSRFVPPDHLQKLTILRKRKTPYRLILNTRDAEELIDNKIREKKGEDIFELSHAYEGLILYLEGGYYYQLQQAVLEEDIERRERMVNDNISNLQSHGSVTESQAEFKRSMAAQDTAIFKSKSRQLTYDGVEYCVMPTHELPAGSKLLVSSLDLDRNYSSNNNNITNTGNSELENNNIKNEGINESHSLEEFRKMDELRFVEIEFKFHYQTHGVTVCARDVQAKCSLADLGLTKKDGVTISKQGELFFDLKDIETAKKKEKTALGRLAKSLKGALDTKDAPYKKGKPNYKLSIPEDKRAKEKALRNTEELKEHHGASKEEDPGAAYLREKGDDPSEYELD